MSFANILKRDASSASISSPKQPLSDEEVLQLLKTNITPSIVSTNKKPTLLNDVEKSFLDSNGEIVYDFYRELRNHYENSHVFQKTDYNGFLDIFLNSIHFAETEHESDDDAHNDADETA